MVQKVDRDWKEAEPVLNIRKDQPMPTQKDLEKESGEEVKVDLGGGGGKKKLEEESSIKVAK